MNFPFVNVAFVEAEDLLNQAFPDCNYSRGDIEQVAEWLLKGGCIAIRNSTPDMHVDPEKYVQLVPIPVKF